MDNFRYVNAGDSTLSAGIVAGDTQLSVANQGRFPAALEVGEKLVLTLHPSGLPSTQEIVICTAISGGVMTVTRGAQGTTAQGWPAGTVVGAYLTSEMLGQIRDKLMPISGTNTGDETAARIGMLTAGAVAKTTPANADLIGLADSAASNTLKKLTWSELKAALKTYFDTLYNKYVHPNHSGDVTSVADGEQTIAANAVTNMKLADMANATIKGRFTAGAGDPEDLTAAQARSILNVADGAQKNSDITKAEIEAKLTGIISTHSHTDGNADTVDGYHAQKTAAADKIPVAGADGKLDAGWIPVADSLGKDMGHNNVGSLCFAGSTDSVGPLAVLALPGATVSGSILRAAGFNDSRSDASMYSVALSGTWRCLGYAYNSHSSYTNSVQTLFQRIA